MKTQRNELAKKVDDIFENRTRQYDFDQACAAVVALIQETTAGAPLMPTDPKEIYEALVREAGVPAKAAPEKEVVPIESLAPVCLESPSGKHCGDHRFRKTSYSIHELRCCWCKATIEVKIKEIHVRTEGHGPASGYTEDRFAMPEGWEEGP